MNDYAMQPERFGPIDLVDERGDRLFAQGRVGRRQIDQIAGVRHDRRESAFLRAGAEFADLLVSQREAHATDWRSW